MAQPHTVPLAQVFAVFLRIGLLSFGGPAAQISLMHRALVDETGWLGEKQFLNALSFCMLLPGPEAMQLATFAGWRLHGILGGLIAGLLFVLPGALVIFALAVLYVSFGDLPLVALLFLGVKAAVLIIVLEALFKVSKRALKHRMHWAIAACAFVGIFFFALPFPLIVLGAGVFGAVFAAQESFKDPPKIETSPLRTALTVLIGLAIWLLPLWALDVLTGSALLSAVGVFFAKLAVVTFGGAYAVLAYMAQDVVTGFGWLSAGEMMDALGLAETTPGPLILVTQFVGFLAGFREGGYALALAAGLVTLWATFVPCFVWIFTGAPYIDWISGQTRLSGALGAITAAVVGVILNLSLWFALHVLFDVVTLHKAGPLTLWLPDLASLNVIALVLSLICAMLLFRMHLAIGWVMAISGLGALVLNAFA